MRRLFIYAAPLFFILSWWCLSFSRQSPAQNLIPMLGSKLPFNSEVQPIDRTRLFQALNGDFDLMTKLMLEWDLEAQLLRKKGYEGIRRLKAKRLLAHLRGAPSPKSQKPLKYFPQTYLAAGILLALVEESSITSLPGGLRHYSRLFPNGKLDRIASDSDPHFLETIEGSDSTLAFVSPYSDPCTLYAMQQRSIPMVDLGCIATPEDLQKAVSAIGAATAAPEKAELLNTFIDSALIALENHLATRRSQNRDVLYVNHHTIFSAPTNKTLMGHILTRLDINRPLQARQSEGWSIPLDVEDIAALNPDCIICVGPRGPLSEKLQGVKAALSGQIHFVDPGAQGSPSQHFLLGMYDLYDILMRLP